MIIKEINIYDENPYKRNGMLIHKKTRIHFNRAETLRGNWARRFISPSREYRKFLPEVFDLVELFLFFKVEGFGHGVSDELSASKRGL